MINFQESLDTPLVSIIIPVYNSETLIVETLNSVLAQTFTNWECIIIDDGSKDSTKQVIQEYVDKDSRFILLDRPDSYNSGGNGARNYGFMYARGEYIQWLDSDDLLDRKKLEYNLEKIHNEDKLTICFSRYYYYDTNTQKKYLGSPFINRNIYDPVEYLKLYCLNGSGFISCSLFHSKELTNSSGLWNEGLLKNQDGEFIIRLVSNSSQLLFDNRSEVYYRINPNGKSSKYRIADGSEDLKTMKIIAKKIQTIHSFPDSNTYCATLFNLLKFEYPNSIKLWHAIDIEINKLGGKIFYTRGSKKFKFIWKIFGLKFAQYLFHIKNDLKNYIKKVLRRNTNCY
jgi:glycosyltransferase involved in cell wall biosynthesis